MLALGYIFVCGLYIWLSGEVAVRLAGSVEALQTIELHKGWGFVLVTGIATFAATYFLLVKIRSQDELLASHRRILVDAQARVLAGTFAAGIAHDINNVLGVVEYGLAKLEIRDAHSEDIERMRQAHVMIKDLTTRLQRLGKPGAGLETTLTDVGVLLRQTVDFASLHGKVKTCRVHLSIAGPCTAPLNTVLFEQMVMNLMVNAAEATSSKGRIEVRLGCESDRAFVEIHDDGPGIREEDREAVLRAYHTTKPYGTGLGLSTVRICAEAHGGSVEIGTSPLGGALVRVVLPLGASSGRQ
jgi:signal transduction histidine kinase